MITASEWREVIRNTLRAFLTLSLSPSGIVLRECSYHERDSTRWVGLPSKPRIDSEGRHCIDPATGKRLWSPIVEIRGKAERERFQAAALAAVDKLLGGGAR
jgi:hypothetical protein